MSDGYERSTLRSFRLVTNGELCVITSSLDRADEIQEFRTERKQINKTQQKIVFFKQRNDKIKIFIYKKNANIQSFIDERLLSREQSVVAIISRKQQTAAFVSMSSGNTLFL